MRALTAWPDNIRCVAFTATIFLLSLAGIPLTGGFLAKYYMIAAVMQTGNWLWLVIFALLCAAVSVYYYFRVIQAMYFKEGEAQQLEISPAFKVMLILLALIVILLGIFPIADRPLIYYLYLIQDIPDGSQQRIFKLACAFHRIHEITRYSFPCFPHGKEQ